MAGAWIPPRAAAGSSGAGSAWKATAMHDAALVAILVVLASFMYLRWRISRLKSEVIQLRSQLGLDAGPEEPAAGNA